MADISTFPTRHTIIETSPKVANIGTFTVASGETVKAGMVLTVDPTTGDSMVTPADSDDAAPVIGVALYGATAGNPVAVAMAGTICYVANEDASTAIGEGIVLIAADCDVGGLVCAQAGGGDEYVVGVALEDIAANGWGRALITPYESKID